MREAATAKRGGGDDGAFVGGGGDAEIIEQIALAGFNAFIADYILNFAGPVEMAAVEHLPAGLFVAEQARCGAFVRLFTEELFVNIEAAGGGASLTGNEDSCSQYQHPAGTGGNDTGECSGIGEFHRVAP